MQAAPKEVWVGSSDGRKKKVSTWAPEWLSTRRQRLDEILPRVSPNGAETGAENRLLQLSTTLQYLLYHSSTQPKYCIAHEPRLYSFTDTSACAFGLIQMILHGETLYESRRRGA